MSRITVSIPKNLEVELKQFAEDKRTSISRVTTEAIEFYLNDQKRRRLGRKVLELIGKQNVSPNAIKELEAGRLSACPEKLILIFNDGRD